MVVLAVLACSCRDVDAGAEVALAAPVDAVPLFRAPFAGSHPVTNFYDHGSRRDAPVTTTGRAAYGIKGHRAYDFGMPVGTELVAMADGVVVTAGDLGPKRCAGGKVAKDNVQVRILHRGPDGNDYVTELHHLSRALVRVGDVVAAGQLVARSGSSGCSSGPHLHLEVLRVTRRAKGYPIDPYGWSGEGGDPRGVASPWMWLPGREPPLRRTEKAAVERGDGVVPHRLTATDGVDPVGGEWLDLGVRRDDGRSWSLAGMSLRNAAGETVALPDRTLAPGEELRVWTRRELLGPDEVSLGLDHELWDDLGDCAILLGPDGVVRGTLSFGRGGACSRVL